jgi:hypothetical protein
MSIGRHNFAEEERVIVGEKAALIIGDYLPVTSLPTREMQGESAWFFRGDWN